MNSRVKATAVVGSVLLLAVLIVLTVTMVAAAPRWQDPGADLELTKTADNYSPNAGETVQFTLTVTNTSMTVTATNVVLEDLLPAGVTVESVSPSTGSCTTGIPGEPLAPLTCNLGEMPAGRTNVVRVTVRIDPDYVDPELPTDYRELENDAEVYSETFDPDNDNNRVHVILQVGTSSDVWMWKTGPDFATAGEEMSYHIRVRNLGPSTLRTFHFVDVLPLEVAYLGYEIEQGTGTCIYPWPMTGDHAAHCYLDDMAPGGVSIVHLRVLVSPDVPLGTVIWNSIGGWFADSYVDEVFGPREWETEVIAAADLSIEKTSEPPKIFPGEQKVYHITVTNNGPSDAPNVVVSDTLPMELRYQIDTDNCDVVDGPPDLLRCDLGTIPAGESVQFDIHALVEPDYPVTQMVEITNTAEVWMETEDVRDPNWENNSDWTTNLILPPNAADLEITKTADDYEPYAGDTVQFTLIVTNTGPLPATNVVVQDLLPAGVTVESVSPSSGSCTTGIPGDPLAPLTCNLGEMSSGEASTVSVDVVIDPDYMGALENDAVVSSDIFDPNNGNNRSHVLIWVEPFSYLNLVKQGPTDIMAGEEIQYWIFLRNDGPSTARNVLLWDELPAGVSLLDAQVMIGDGSCAPNSTTCSLGDLAPHEWNYVGVRGYVEPWLGAETVITNTVRAIADSPFYQPVPEQPISDTVTTTVHSAADLAIWKSADPYIVYAGEEMRYDVSVTNNGPSVAYNVVVTDALPISVTYEIDTDDCLQVGATNTYTCTLGDIPPGETSTFSIWARVKPDTLGMINNRVDVISETEDPNPNNNWDSEANLVLGRADLRVQKFGKPEGEVRAGDKLTYTIIVDNLGTGYAHNVSLDDVMRSDGSFDLLEVTYDRPALCVPITGTFQHDLDLTCALTDTLEVKGPAPGSGRWMLTITVQANEPQDINNIAYVAGSDYDPDLSNNEDRAEHEITAVADLALTKEAWGEMLVGCEGQTELWLNEVAAGGTVTYTLTVSNTGSSTAENVVVLDEPLPSPELLEINGQSIKASQGNCQTGHIVDQQRLKCNLGTILPGGAATVTFVAHVPSWVPDNTPLDNGAQVYSDMFDDNNGNDMVSNYTIVSRVADLGVEKSQEPETTLPGLEVVYTIRVDNLGPSDAHGVLISDTLPFNATSITVEGCASDGGQCDVPCEPPTCPAGECPWPDVDFVAQADIPAGEWVIYTLTATPEWVPCETITNTVEVGFAPWLDDIDPCPDNDLAWTTSDPECNFVPLALKSYPGPDSPP